MPEPRQPGCAVSTNRCGCRPIRAQERPLVHPGVPRLWKVIHRAPGCHRCANATSFNAGNGDLSPPPGWWVQRESRLSTLGGSVIRRVHDSIRTTTALATSLTNGSHAGFAASRRSIPENARFPDLRLRHGFVALSVPACRANELLSTAAPGTGCCGRAIHIRVAATSPGRSAVGRTLPRGDSHDRHVSVRHWGKND